MAREVDFIGHARQIHRDDLGGGAVAEAAAAAFKLMSTCLLAGRTNSAHTAKVRALRNLRAALHINMTRRPRNRYVFFEKFNFFIPPEPYHVIYAPFLDKCWFGDKARSVRSGERFVNMLSLSLAVSNPQVGQLLLGLVSPACAASSGVTVALARL